MSVHRKIVHRAADPKVGVSDKFRTDTGRTPARVLFGTAAWETLRAWCKQRDPVDSPWRPAGTPPPAPPTSGTLYGIPAALDACLHPYGWLMLDADGGVIGAGVASD